jgi:hypothetical protein
MGDFGAGGKKRMQLGLQSFALGRCKTRHRRRGLGAKANPEGTRQSGAE